MTKPVIQIRGISKTYALRSGQYKVLEDVNLDIAGGERVSLVGPNDSGKTTLLRIILGIEMADTGSVSFHGFDTEHGISYVPQDYRNALFPWLRLYNNLALVNGLDISNTQLSEDTSLSEAYKEYYALADTYRLSLDLTKYPYQLSSGEQQIFLLLRAVLSYPALMVLDEPLSAVDFGRRRLILQHLGKWIPEMVTTVIFASHDFEEAVMLADRVVIFDRDSGRLKLILHIDLPWLRTLDMRGMPQFKSFVEAIIGAIA